jgi:hypothetical protein
MEGWTGPKTFSWGVLTRMTVDFLQDGINMDSKSWFCWLSIDNVPLRFNSEGASIAPRFAILVIISKLLWNIPPHFPLLGLRKLILLVCIGFNESIFILGIRLTGSMGTDFSIGLQTVRAVVL